MSKAEHLEWAKGRALEFVALNDLHQAWMSFFSDMNKHEELRSHLGLELGNLLYMSGKLNSPEEITNFINGFS